MSSDKKYPPRWADRFLELYCNPDLLEQIQGDVHELFYYRMKEKNAFHAKKAFIIDVLRFFRWRNIKRSKPTYYHNNTIAMFKNYMKIGWRSIIKQKGTSSINIFGLATAVACCIVAYLLVEGVWLKGMYHENKDEIYMLTHTADEKAGITRYGVVSSPMTQLAAQELPGVKNITSVNINRYVIKHKNETFSERTLFVDPSFMDMFSYEIEAGYGGALNEPHQVIITESAAQKFFGDSHPIGQELSIIIKGEPKEFIVGGVMEDLPSTAMFSFEVLVNNKNLFAEIDKIPLDQQWKNYNSWVFVQMEEGVNSQESLAGLGRMLKKQNEILVDAPYLDLQLEPYTSLVINAKSIESGPVNYGSMAPQILLVSIALFMLMLAVFNYINISILMATKRLKEIGIRKVMGSKKNQLVFQFLSENLITCFLAMILGGIIAVTLFLPWFNQMASKNLQLDLLNNGYLISFLGALLVFITFVSGIYPAFYISSFKPVAIFARKLQIGGKSKLTGALLTFQFTLAIITIVAGIAVLHTNQVNKTRSWGYDNQSKIVVNTPTEKDYLSLRQALAEQPEIIELAGSMDMIGHGLEEELITYQHKEYSVDILRGAANYAELMDLQLKEGSFFNPELATEAETSIIVNERLMDQLGLSFPVKELITLDSIQYRIIGVVKDFHTHFFTFSIDPTLLMISPDTNFNYLTAKLLPGTEDKMEEKVKTIWRNEVENGLYQGELQANVFDLYFEDFNGVSNMLIFTAILAILISAMGLFGLVSLNINARLKDYSIRKILGASLTHLAQKIFKKYLILWAISCVIGGLLAQMAITNLLDMVYAFHSGVSTLTTVIAIIILLLVILFTVGTQVWKVKRNNPADTLKME